jgi:peptidoglycan/xylan/chitin deacetylase (PgdA/CDA1 family)
MTRAQLTSQPKFVMFGSHGKSHVHLSRIDPASARIEIEESRRVLQEILGRTVRLIAMPFGDFNSNTIEACRLAGYTHVYTLSPENIDPSRPKFVRGRVSVDPTDGPIEFFEGQWCVRVVKP